MFSNQRRIYVDAEFMKYIMKLVILFALIVLIGLRIFLDNSNAIVFIQYAGLGIAIFDFFGKLLRINRSWVVILVATIVALLLMLVAILGIAEIIPWLYDTKALDVITLLTLAISLPDELYLKLLERERSYVK